MILLIGGTSCTGKTYIAHQIMKRNYIPYFSLDILMMGLFNSSEKSNFDPMDEKEVISKAVWPITEKMIEANIENCTNYTYEGFQILPKNITGISNEFRKAILPIFIVFSEEYIETNYEIIKSKRGIIESRSDIDDKELMKKRNKCFKEECTEEKLEINVIHKDYRKESEAIIVDIEKKIKSMY